MIQTDYTTILRTRRDQLLLKAAIYDELLAEADGDRAPRGRRARATKARAPVAARPVRPGLARSREADRASPLPPGRAVSRAPTPPRKAARATSLAKALAKAAPIAKARPAPKPRAEKTLRPRAGSIPDRILADLADHPFARAYEVAVRLRNSTQAVQSALMRLKAAELVTQHGVRGNMTYALPGAKARREPDAAPAPAPAKAEAEPEAAE